MVLIRFSKTKYLCSIVAAVFIIALFSVCSVAFAGGNGADHTAVVTSSDIEITSVSADLDFVAFFYEGLARVEKGEKYGYMDTTGKLITSLEYSWHSQDFEDGFAAVAKDGSHGYIDKSGKIVIPLEYDYSYSFYNGLAVVGKDGRYGVIKKDNSFAVSMKQGYVYDFYDGLLVIRDIKSDKIGITDMSGNVILPFKYDDIDSFFDGYAMVEQDGKFGFIDTNGKEVISPIYDYSWEWKWTESGYAAFTQDGRWGLIDIMSGEIALPFEYDDGSIFTRDYAVVKKDGKIRFVNIKTNTLKSAEYDYMWMPGSEEGEWLSAAVMKDDKWGFIDANCDLMIPTIYEDMWFFREGLAAVKKDGKWGFIDIKGNTVIPFEYDDRYTYQFTEGLAPVCKDGKTGFINTKGDIVVPIEYDYSTEFRDGLTCVSKDGKWSILKNTAFVPGV